MATANRGSAAKRSSGEAPAAPVAVVPQNQQQANANISAEDAENNRKRIEREREMDFSRQEHSLRNRIHDSGYVWFDIPGYNETFVGHLDDFTDEMKRRKGTHIGLERRAPVKGSKVVAKGGEPVFFLPKDFASWAGVQITNEDGTLGDNLIPAKADPERTKDRRAEAGLDRERTELERVNQPDFKRQSGSKRSKTASSKKSASKSSSKKSGSSKKSSSKKAASKSEQAKEDKADEGITSGGAQGSLL